MITGMIKGAPLQNALIQVLPNLNFCVVSLHGIKYDLNELIITQSNLSQFYLSLYNPICTLKYLKNDEVALAADA